MIESLRAVGYTPQTAIADLIDNSIAAHASHIWLKFWWDGRESWVSITDDGDGMNSIALTEAMRPGTIGPLETRNPEDLGRFGLGLKTASFSQCRQLTVGSRFDAEHDISYRRWDLDYVQQTNRWRLLTSPRPQAMDKFDKLASMASGTTVLWESMDRLVGNVDSDNNRAHNRFLEIVDDVESHLSMVFHRLLAGSNPQLRMSIDCGTGPQAIKPWDPFLANHPATTPTPPETLKLAEGNIAIRGYVLPHKSRFETPEQHTKAGGPGGWNARQGFYVYRNNRLVVAGSWLGLGQGGTPWTREEHYKLARIAIDIPNTMDFSWHLDVKKSDARPPAEIRDRLKSLALQVRSQAKQVFSHRGSNAPTGKHDELPPIWRTQTIDNRPIYRIDRKHPFTARTIKELPKDARQYFSALITLIEQTVPVDRIWIDAAEAPDTHPKPFEYSPDSELAEFTRAWYSTMVQDQGLTPDQAKDRIRGAGFCLENIHGL